MAYASGVRLEGPIILAHAIGERYELPIPLVLFVVGGATVVLVSFLLVARRTPVTRADVVADDTIPPLAYRPVIGLLSILAMLFIAVVGITGTQETSNNLAPLFFWVIVWIGVPMLCEVLGKLDASGQPVRQHGAAR